MRGLQAVLGAALVVAVVTTFAGSAAAGPRAARTVKVAFLQGEQVVYVDRPGSTLSSAVRALLAGPTTGEARREITTQIPSGTRLRRVSVKDRSRQLTSATGSRSATEPTV